MEVEDLATEVYEGRLEENRYGIKKDVPWGGACLSLFYDCFTEMRTYHLTFSPGKVFKLVIYLIMIDGSLSLVSKWRVVLMLVESKLSRGLP